MGRLNRAYVIPAKATNLVEAVALAASLRAHGGKADIHLLGDARVATAVAALGWSDVRVLGRGAELTLDAGRYQRELVVLEPGLWLRREVPRGSQPLVLSPHQAWRRQARHPHWLDMRGARLFGGTMFVPELRPHLRYDETTLQHLVMPYARAVMWAQHALARAGLGRAESGGVPAACTFIALPQHRSELAARASSRRELADFDLYPTPQLAPAALSERYGRVA